MSLEAVKKVIEAEQLSAKQKEEGERAAKSLIAEAKKKGAGLIDVARWEAEMKVKKMMTEEEQEDAKNGKIFRRAIANLQDEIKAEGRQRLDQAAEWIAGRVVEF